MHINILSQHVIIPGAKCAKLLRWGDAGCQAFELLRGAGDWSLGRFWITNLTYLWVELVGFNRASKLLVSKFGKIVDFDNLNLLVGC